MTGDYLEDDLLNRVRGLYGLGKRNFPHFPKTRKIVFVGDVPTYLAGWVRVTLHVTSDEVPQASARIPAPRTPPRAEPGLETGAIHSLNVNKGYGKIQPDEGGEPIRFEFADANMMGMEKGVRATFRRIDMEGEPRAVDVKRQ